MVDDSCRSDVKLADYHIRLSGGPDTGYLVLVEELPGCVAVGKTIPQLEVALEQAIFIYLDQHVSSRTHRGSR